MHLISNLKHFAALHIYTLIHAYDPILDLNCKFSTTSQNFSKLKLQFPIFIMLIHALSVYGTLMLEYDAKGRIEWNQLFQSPHIFTHQAFLRPMWPHTDMLVLDCLVGAIALYAALWATPTMKPQYQMYRNGDHIVQDFKGECW